jgi:hypothetical protein
MVSARRPYAGTRRILVMARGDARSVLEGVTEVVGVGREEKEKTGCVEVDLALDNSSMLGREWYVQTRAKRFTSNETSVQYVCRVCTPPLRLNPPNSPPKSVLSPTLRPAHRRYIVLQFRKRKKYSASTSVGMSFIPSV